MINNPIEDLKIAFRFSCLPTTPIKAEIERQYENNEISATKFLTLVKRYLEELDNREAKNDK